MLKLLTILSIVSATITSITIICTLLTTYQFMFVGQMFNSYVPIQIMLTITMIIWGIKFILCEKGWKRVVYPFIFLSTAAGSIFFLMNSVQ